MKIKKKTHSVELRFISHAIKRTLKILFIEPQHFATNEINYYVVVWKNIS